MVRAQTATRRPLDLTNNPKPVVLVPVKGWDRPTNKALRFAMWLSPDVIAIHLSNLSGEEASEEDKRLRRSRRTGEAHAPDRAPQGGFRHHRCRAG